MPVIFRPKPVAILAGAGGGSGFTPNSGFSFTGTFAPNNTVRISKPAGGFGTKPTPAGGSGVKPMCYFPMSASLTRDSTYSRLSATVDTSAPKHMSWQSSIKPTNGAGAADCAQNDTDGNAAFDISWGADTKNVYCFSHRNITPDIATWETGGNTANIKFQRARASIGGGVPNTYFFANHTTLWGLGSDTTGGAVYHETGLSQDYMSGYSSTPWDNMTGWHTSEVWYRSATGPSVGDGQCLLWINGRAEFYFPETTLGSPIDRTTTGWRTCNGDPSFTGWDQMSVGFQCSNQSTDPIPASAHCYFGPTMIDDSPCRALLSTGSAIRTTFTSTNPVDFAIVTGWTDTDIDLWIRDNTVLSSLSGIHLVVMTSDGYTQFDCGVGT